MVVPEGCCVSWLDTMSNDRSLCLYDDGVEDVDDSRRDRVVSPFTFEPLFAIAEVIEAALRSSAIAEGNMSKNGCLVCPLHLFFLLDDFPDELQTSWSAGGEGGSCRGKRETRCGGCSNLIPCLLHRVFTSKEEAYISIIRTK